VFGVPGGVAGGLVGGVEGGVTGGVDGDVVGGVTGGVLGGVSGGDSDTTGGEGGSSEATGGEGGNSSEADSEAAGASSCARAGGDPKASVAKAISSSDNILAELAITALPRSQTLGSKGVFPSSMRPASGRSEALLPYGAASSW
jgi:hypothetical protein